MDMRPLDSAIYVQRNCYGHALNNIVHVHGRVKIYILLLYNTVALLIFLKCGLVVSFEIQYLLSM